MSGLPKRMTVDEWNNVYFPKCKGLIIEDVGFLVIYQIFKGRVRLDGKMYRISAWAPPDGDSYVDAEEVTDDSNS